MPGGTDKLVILILIISALRNVKLYYNIILDSQIKRIVLSLMIILLYVVIVDLMSYGRIVFSGYLFSTLFLIVGCFLYSVYAYRILGKYSNNNTNDLILYLFMAVGIFQVVQILLHYSFPEYRYWYFNVLTKYANSPSKISFDFSTSIVRGYGLGQNFLFTMPIALGMVSAMILHYAIEKRSVLLYSLLPLFIFGIIVNARVGLIPIGVYVIIRLMSDMLINVKFRSMLRNTISIIIFGVMLFYIFPIIVDYIPSLNRYYKWVLLLFDPTYTGYYLMQQQVNIPDYNLYLITGRGLYNAGMNVYNLTTDIGYLQQLNYGGIIFIGIIVRFFVTIYQQTIASNRQEVILIWSLYISIAIVNVKGNIFSDYLPVKIILILAIYSQINEYIKKKSNLSTSK